MVDGHLREQEVQYWKLCGAPVHRARPGRTPSYHRANAITVCARDGAPSEQAGPRCARLAED